MPKQLRLEQRSTSAAQWIATTDRCPPAQLVNLAGPPVPCPATPLRLRQHVNPSRPPVRKSPTAASAIPPSIRSAARCAVTADPVRLTGAGARQLQPRAVQNPRTTRPILAGRASESLAEAAVWIDVTSSTPSEDDPRPGTSSVTDSDRAARFVHPIGSLLPQLDGPRGMTCPNASRRQPRHTRQSASIECTRQRRQQAPRTAVSTIAAGREGMSIRRQNQRHAQKPPPAPTSGDAPAKNRTFRFL